MIRNLKDLCEYFCADGPGELSKRVYKGTDCGARISVQLPDGTWVHNGEMVKSGAVRVVTRTDVACNTITPISPVMDSDPLGLFGEPVEKLGEYEYTCKKCGHNGQVTENDVNMKVPVKKSAWEDITEVTAFTLQTIVEGSEATVDSTPFVLPVAKSDVDAFMTYMEEEATRLWELANYDYFNIQRDGVYWAEYIQTWDGPEFNCHADSSDDEETMIRQKMEEDRVMENSINERGDFTLINRAEFSWDGHNYVIERYEPEYY